MKYRKAAFLALAVVSLLALAVFTPFEEYVVALQAWAQDNPTTALFAVGAFFAFTVVGLLPSSIPLMLAGMLFGLSKGMAVAWVSGLFASTVAFMLARTLARDWVESAIRRHSLFTVIDRAVQRKGFTIVLLLRLALLPFPWLNYALGLTSVSLRDYVAATNIGMLLPYFIFVYLGTTFASLSALLGGEIEIPREQVMAGVAVGIVALTLVAVVLRVSMRTLNQELSRK